MFRYFVGRGAEDLNKLQGNGLLDRLEQRGLALPHSRVDRDDLEGSPGDLPTDAVFIEQPRIPFVSYAYEWPFGMLKAAALLHLEIGRIALESGFILKDASSYNVQFIGPTPVFVDLGSFTRYVEGEPWRAYAQFCRMFLNPLLLRALTGLHYHAWLRSSLDGIAPEALGRLLKLRHKLRPAVFKNVVLQALFQRHFASLSPKAMPETARLTREAVDRNMEAMQQTIQSLRQPRAGSAWASYGETRRYSPEASARKARFVEVAVASARPRILWDLGSNCGDYAIAAGQSAETVVAMDNDADMVEFLYHRVRGTQPNVLPVVMDLLNPSPNQGWAESERQGLSARGKADFVLCLALLHHIRIAGNVPIRSFITWLANHALEGVVEFVPKSDPMVQRLLWWREDVYGDYDQNQFEAALHEQFEVTEVCRLPDSERVLYRFARS